MKSAITLLIGTGILGCAEVTTNAHAFHHVTDFESGWDGWEPKAAYDSIGGSTVRTESRLASESAVGDGTCAWLGGENSTDALHRWIEKGVSVPAGAYDARLTAQIGPVGGFETSMWAIGAIAKDPPRKHDDFTVLGAIAQHPTPQRPTTMSVTLERRIDASEPITVWFAIGYWHTFEIWGWRCIDNVEISIERKGP